jgi:glycosyltransferase involved in cell wall biosynthesis
MPTVSVILPVSDMEGFIEDALNSLFNQTLRDFELIVIDDASTDRSAEIVEASSDPRVKLISNVSKRGISASLNHGLRLAKGKYIARLDADDVADFRRLERQVRFLDENPSYGLVGSWMKSFGERSRVIRYPTTDAAIRTVMLFRSAFGHPAVMFRRDWQRGNLGLYDEALETAQDFDYWERLSREWKCANIPECLTSYRMHPNQATSRNSALRREIEREIILRQVTALGLASWDTQRTLKSKWLWGRELFADGQASQNFSRRILLGEKVQATVRPGLLRVLKALKVLRLAHVVISAKDFLGNNALHLVNGGSRRKSATDAFSP